jgi:nicotinate-nucleotide adenylyltransferase
LHTHASTSRIPRILDTDVEFHHRNREGCPSRLALLPGTFNPPTIAHIALAQAAQPLVDEVVFVLPQLLPHKNHFGATLSERVELLRAVDTQASIATTQGGLYIEIAREFRAHFGPATHISLLCGRDAAERILTWDYGRQGVVEEMLAEFEFLIAPRKGEFDPPSDREHRMKKLELFSPMDEISSTELRARIASGDAWEQLVPSAIVERVREIYS